MSKRGFPSVKTRFIRRGRQALLTRPQRGPGAEGGQKRGLSGRHYQAAQLMQECLRQQSGRKTRFIRPAAHGDAGLGDAQDLKDSECQQRPLRKNVAIKYFLYVREEQKRGLPGLPGHAGRAHLNARFIQAASCIRNGHHRSALRLQLRVSATYRPQG